LVHCLETIGRPMGAGGDHWWQLDGTDPDRLAAEVGQVWNDIAPGWFAARQDPASAAAASELDGDFFRAATVCLGIGDRAAAQAAVTAGLAAHSARGENVPLDLLRELAWRHGLDVGEYDSAQRWQVLGPHCYTEEAWRICENPFHALEILGRLAVHDKRK